MISALRSTMIDLGGLPMEAVGRPTHARVSDQQQLCTAVTYVRCRFADKEKTNKKRSGEKILKHGGKDVNC